MILLGMTGPIGHGKTTFAGALEELVDKTAHYESSLIIAEVADAMHAALKTPFDPYDVDALNDWLKSLPAILLETVHVKCSFEDIKLSPSEIERHPIEYQKLILHAENLRRNPELLRHQIDAENKEAYRPFLQWLGGYLVSHVDNGIWYNEIVRRIRNDSDKDLVIVGGLRFPSDATILRKAGGIIVKVYRPGHLQNDMLDPTERERENIRIDTTVLSNGTIDDVKACAKVFLADIKADNLKSRYQTKKF